MSRSSHQINLRSLSEMDAIERASSYLQQNDFQANQTEEGIIWRRKKLFKSPIYIKLESNGDTITIQGWFSWSMFPGLEVGENDGQGIFRYGEGKVIADYTGALVLLISI